MARSTNRNSNNNNPAKQAKQRLKRILKNLQVPLDSDSTLVAALMQLLNSRPVMLRSVAKRVGRVDSPCHRERAVVILHCIRVVLARTQAAFGVSRQVLTRELLDVTQAVAVKKILGADGGSAPPPQSAEPAIPSVQPQAAEPAIPSVPSRWFGVRPVLRAAEPAIPSVQPQAAEPAIPSVQPQMQDSPPDQEAIQRCVVCMEQHVQVVFLPCRHMACCASCSDEMYSRADPYWNGMECPLCRRPVESRIAPIVVGYE